MPTLTGLDRNLREMPRSRVWRSTGCPTTPTRRPT